MAEALRIDQVTVRYGQRVAVRNVSFSAEYGQVVGLLGPNGAGKTTLLKAIGGILQGIGTAQCEGAVRCAGRDLASLSMDARAKNVAYVPQRSLLDASLSVEEVVQQGRYCHRRGFSSVFGRRDREAVEHALQSVDVQFLAARPFNRLSGGERRRVLLARALATEARIILLDEPTASLDIAHALSLFRTLKQLAARGHCIVCVLHDLGNVRDICDTALLMRDGTADVVGSPHEVVAAAHVRRVYGVELVEAGGLGYCLPGSTT